MYIGVLSSHVEYSIFNTLMDSSLYGDSVYKLLWTPAQINQHPGKLESKDKCPLSFSPSSSPRQCQFTSRVFGWQSNVGLVRKMIFFQENCSRVAHILVRYISRTRFNGCTLKALTDVAKSSPIKSTSVFALGNSAS